jgi:hypothetical protein
MKLRRLMALAILACIFSNVALIRGAYSWDMDSDWQEIHQFEPSVSIPDYQPQSVNIPDYQPQSVNIPYYQRQKMDLPQIDSLPFGVIEPTGGQYRYFTEQDPLVFNEKMEQLRLEIEFRKTLLEGIAVSTANLALCLLPPAWLGLGAKVAITLAFAAHNVLSMNTLLNKVRFEVAMITARNQQFEWGREVLGSGIGMYQPSMTLPYYWTNPEISRTVSGGTQTILGFSPTVTQSTSSRRTRVRTSSRAPRTPVRINYPSTSGPRGTRGQQAQWYFDQYYRFTGNRAVYNAGMQAVRQYRSGTNWNYYQPRTSPSYYGSRRSTSYRGTSASRTYTAPRVRSSTYRYRSYRRRR